MDKPRRSAGMRGSPANPNPDRAISTTPKARAEAPAPERVSSSAYPRPKILMGEVTAPKGQLIAAERDAFRAFMLRARLTPTSWARAAGVAPGEIMAFLSGHARAIAPETVQKLARAANVGVEALFT
jgi:hypothetical protein